MTTQTIDERDTIGQTTGGVLVDSAVAAIAAIADRPSSREWLGWRVLSCVLLKGGSAYAADGFRAMRVDLPRQSATAETPVAVRAKTLAAAVKSLGRNRSGMGRFVEVLQGPDGVQLSANGETVEAETADGTFPDVESLMPRSAPVASVSFNATLLGGVLEAMSKAGVENDMVTLSLHGTGDNARIVLDGWLPDDDGGYTREISGLVMPMVTRHGGWS